MKANQLATLVLRLLGIFCIIQVIPAIAMTASTFPIIISQEHLSRSEIASMVMATLFLAVQIAIGILLIVKSMPWGEKLTPGNADDTNIVAVSFEQVQMLAFAVVGALIFADALPVLLNSISSLFSLLNRMADGEHSPLRAQYLWRTLLSTGGNLLKTALGLWMFFGARSFAKFCRPLCSPRTSN